MLVKHEVHIDINAGDLALGAANGGLRQELPPGTAALVIHTEPDRRYDRLAAKARAAVQAYCAGYSLLAGDDPGIMAGAHAAAIADAMMDLQEELAS